MTSSISFFCGPLDNKKLQDYATSLGFYLVSTRIDKEVSSDPSLGPYCYLSLVPKSMLHPFGNPPVRVSSALDPALGFMRAYFQKPYLVLGHIQWTDGPSNLACQTLPYYRKIVKWIKKEWGKHGDIYIGNEAKSLITEGAERVNSLPF